MSARRIITRFEKNGEKLVSVSLGRYGKAEAVLYEPDFDFLCRLGLSTSWRQSPLGYVVTPACKASGQNVSVARCLVDAAEGQVVRYIDGDKKNLRSKNLVVVEGGYATRRDRDFITPPTLLELYREVMREPVERAKPYRSSGSA